MSHRGINCVLTASVRKRTSVYAISLGYWLQTRWRKVPPSILLRTRMEPVSISGHVSLYRWHTDSTTCTVTCPHLLPPWHEWESGLSWVVAWVLITAIIMGSGWCPLGCSSRSLTSWQVMEVRRDCPSTITLPLMTSHSA